MPLRGSVADAKRLRGAQRRLDRRAAEAPAAARSRSRTGRNAAARRDAPHRAPRGARGTVWIEAGDAGRCSASRASAASAAPRARFSQARSEARSRRREPPLCGALGVAVKRVSVRDQTSRWGSCTAAGVLSYSWRLILAPPLRARLSGGARGGASRRDESLARGSGAWSRASARTGSAPRAGSTRTAPRCTAMARTAGRHLRPIY